jgi:hypothetical protein
MEFLEGKVEEEVVEKKDKDKKVDDDLIEFEL